MADMYAITSVAPEKIANTFSDSQLFMGDNQAPNRSDVTTPPQSPPAKKFRNNSSPFRGAATAKCSALKHVWEWTSNGEEWIEYPSCDSDTLELAFCVQDTVQLPSSSSHVVDLRRFVQRNTSSGRERNIRRRLMSEPDDSSMISISAEPLRFGGRTIYLNRIPGRAEECDTASFTDLVGDPLDIEAILLSSFGTDIEWLLSHFESGTPITLIDQPPKGDSSAASLVPLGNVWPLFQVVHPRFDKGKGGLLDHGTMHCKLIVIKWKNDRGLRIAVTSANLVEFDWHGISQCIWAVDIRNQPSVAQPTSSFGTDLVDFVSRLLRGTQPVTDWVRTLSDWSVKISSQIPQEVNLVASVPGVHSGKAKSRFGQLRLKDILGNPTGLIRNVMFQASSIGLLQKPFYESFIDAVGSSQERFRIVWPEYTKAMNLIGNDHVFMAEKNAAVAHRFMTPLIQLPTREDMLNHSKMIISRDFVYMGSHNFSMSAWGRVVFEGNALQIASYELGIVIKGLEGFRINKSFQLASMEAPELPHITSPWTVDAFRRKVSRGTEQLTQLDKEEIWIPGHQVMSLGDFLSLKSRSGGKPIVVVFRGQNGLAQEFLDNTILPVVQERGELFQITPRDEWSLFGSYSRHLHAFLRLSQVPSLAVQAGGSDLCSRGLKVIEKYDSESEILGIDPDTFLRDIPPDDPQETIEVLEEDEDEPSVTDALANAVNTANQFELLCIDIDGTIVESNTSSVILPHFADFLRQLVPGRIKIALVTNQGAVGLRHWMTTGKFGDPSSLPTQDQVEERIMSIFEKLKSLWTGELTVFMSFRYQSKSGRWAPVPLQFKDDPRWQQEWRKPNGGMIREAMKWAKLGPFQGAKVMMIGDMDSDECAAKSANVRFQRAPNFFTGLDKVDF